MGHSHDHGTANYNRAFAIGIGLNLAFVIVEFAYGRIANSLALVADAGHNLSDVLGLALAWGAAILSTRRPTLNRTYGLRRSSILAALINAIFLLIALRAIAWESVQRLGSPPVVAEATVIWVSALGIVINTISAMLFFSGRKGDMNVRGAFLHMASDAAVSAGVVAGGFIIMRTGWYWIDPVVSLLICGVIVVGTWDLLKDSVNLALDAVPEGIDLEAVSGYLSKLPKVAEIHDLHIWGMSTTEAALTAHLVMTEPTCDDAFLMEVELALHHQFGIEHSTLQIETGNRAFPCRCRLTRN